MYPPQSQLKSQLEANVRQQDDVDAPPTAAPISGENDESTMVNDINENIVFESKQNDHDDGNLNDMDQKQDEMGVAPTVV